MLINLLIVTQFLAILSALAVILVRRVQVPVFAGYLCFELALGAVSLWVRGSSSLSMQFWLWGQFLTGAFWIGCFLEIRRHVLARYRGIGSFGTALVLVATALGIAAAWLTATDDRTQLFRLGMFIPRIVAAVLFVAMGILGVVTRHYATRHLPNTMTHARLFWLLMGTQALGLWASNMAPPAWYVPVGAAKMVLCQLCLASWIVMLKAHRDVRFRPTATPEDVELAQQNAQAAMTEVRNLLRP